MKFSPLNARFALFALLALCACAPVVTHSPRVRPGPDLHLTAGTLRLLCDSPCDTGGILPRTGVGMRYGWTSRDSAGAGILAGVSVPVFDVLNPELDVYAQAPAGPTAPVVGLGVATAVKYTMPYVQFGWDPPAGVGAYATVGYTWYWSNPEWNIDGLPDDSLYRAPRYFSPMLSLRLPGEAAAMTIYLSGALGSFSEQRTEYREGEPEPAVTQVRRPLRLLMTGVVLNTPLESMFFPVRRPRPIPPPVGVRVPAPQ